MLRKLGYKRVFRRYWIVMLYVTSRKLELLKPPVKWIVCWPGDNGFSKT